MRHLLDILADLRGQRLTLDILARRLAILLEKIALARPHLDRFQAFQFRIRFGDGVAVEAEFSGQSADGWEGLAGAQRPRCGGGLDLDRSLPGVPVPNTLWRRRCG